MDAKYIKHMILFLSCSTPCTLWITSVVVFIFETNMSSAAPSTGKQITSCVVSLLIRDAT